MKYNIIMDGRVIDTVELESGLDGFQAALVEEHGKDAFIEAMPDCMVPRDIYAVLQVMLKNDHRFLVEKLVRSMIPQWEPDEVASFMAHLTHSL